MSRYCPALLCESAGERLPLIADSFKQLTGRDLIVPESDVTSALWESPKVILAHSTAADPLFFYGNWEFL